VGSINKSPLASGLLTGKFSVDSKITDEQEWRSRIDFEQGTIVELLEKLDTLRDLLADGGRTLAQAALCWIWAHSERTVPIPGFKTAAQVEENAGAMEFGPLNETEMRQIDRILH
jgi:aryl-alcohol dehydrogenase-like predicted oxidoreductase